MKKPALFLDRDGVINIDYGYVHRPEDFHFIDGIFELVRKANDLGYRVVVVTNQAGIGRGYYSESQFHMLTEWMLNQFSQRGATIDAVYFCPDHLEYGVGGYKKESPLRKPSPGMLLQAGKDLDIEFSRSIIIGDKLSDMKAGAAAGVYTRLFLADEWRECDAIVIRHLSEAADYLNNQLPSDV